MKLFINDIKNIGWLQNKLLDTKWGKVFLGLKPNQYFVFSYNLVEEKSSVSVVEAKVLYEINESIYRNMSAEHIGYMKEPFDTSNYLFFSLLKSVCGEEELEKLTNLWITYKVRDIEESKSNLKISLKGNQAINSNISFNTALNNIFKSNQNPVNGLCMVYDIIDNYTQNALGKSIYGELLTGIIKAVKNPNGGLIPEYADSTMRYLIVGEKAASKDVAMSESLAKAKQLYRSGNSIRSVYLETGWYFNKFDLKWRKRISDDTFYFDMDKLSTGNGSTNFIPNGFNLDTISELSEGKVDMQNLVMNGYNGKLKDYISFDEAYKLYPELAEVYSVFSVDYIKSGYSFYFSPSIPNSLVLISGKDGKKSVEKVKYIALHEIQHYVQHFEGFGNGGNENLAKLIDAVGGSSVRDFVNSLSAFQKRFNEVASFIKHESFRKLIVDLKGIKYTNYKIRYRTKFIDVSNYYNSMLDSLEKITQTQDLINQNASNISYYVLGIFSMIEETNPIIEKFINQYVDSSYISFFKKSLEQNKKAVEREERLTKLGWTPRDLYILNFQTYESLIGEVESRFTQQTSRLPKDLRDYFDFYTSETIDPTKVAVYSDGIYMDEGKKVEAGIETTEGKYIIHLPDVFSNSINLLHETGHIIYDFIQDDIIANADLIEKSVLLDKSIEEYFCESFVDYIHRKNIDPMLTADLDYERKVLDLTDFDEYIESVFFYKKEIDENGLILRLEFVNKMLAIEDLPMVDDSEVKNALWESVKNKFSEVFFEEESENEIYSNEVKAEEYLWLFDRYSAYPSTLSWEDAKYKFLKMLTDEEKNIISIDYDIKNISEAFGLMSEKKILVAKK